MMSRMRWRAGYTEIKLESPPNRVAGGVFYDHGWHLDPCANSTPFFASTDTAGGTDYAVQSSTLKYAEFNWDKWPTIDATYNFYCIFFYE